MGQWRKRSDDCYRGTVKECLLLLCPLSQRVADFQAMAPMDQSGKLSGASVPSSSVVRSAEHWLHQAENETRAVLKATPSGHCTAVALK